MLEFFVISLFVLNFSNLNGLVISSDATNATRVSMRADIRKPIIDFNESKVIVWEKCGVTARTKISPIFKSVLNDQNKLSLFYNPSINSLIFEHENEDSTFSSHVVNIPENDLNTLFFSFKDPNKISIYVDCPSTTKHKFSWENENISKMTRLDLFTNAEGFDSMDKALRSFQCRSVVTGSSGSVVQFPGLLMGAKPKKTSTTETPISFTPELSQTGNPTLIYSFNHDGVLYSFNYLDGLFQIISSNGSEIYINTTRSVPPNGFYLVFSNKGLHIYDKCPYHMNEIGFWPTDMFKNKFKIETSRVYTVGNAANEELLDSYCTLTGFGNVDQAITENTCIPSDQVQNELVTIQKTLKLSNTFLPNKEQFEKLDQFKSIENFDLSFFVDSVHRVLFASRQNAPTRFFNRPISDYKEGFSDGLHNFWLGLNTLNKVTNEQTYGLRIEFKIKDILYAEEYSMFRVGNSEENYRVFVDGLKTPSFLNFMENNNTEFSALDYGLNSYIARRMLGGFWHKMFALNTEHFYCFSCETGSDEKGSFYDNSEGDFKDIRYTNMYLTL
ncbi:unnamed protein product [Brachionus calyciflorus]|uniref:Fibrinogen C-terminal domain-containing protein n=1 Tax=Brachionus calyciflorus TaxID=104777 RepID=A0A813U8Q4_9BILA|nr:unnamed protein product [Brachionus calyciflorus]